MLLPEKFQNISEKKNSLEFERNGENDIIKDNQKGKRIGLTMYRNSYKVEIINLFVLALDNLQKKPHI